MEKARVIPLTKGYVAIVSQEDFRRVNRYKWRVHMSAGNKRKPGAPYARTDIKGKGIYLHRFIMGLPDPIMPVDHLNHQTLDCRRTNLELVDTITNLKRRRKVKNGSA